MKTNTIWRSGLLSAALCTVVLAALPWLQGCGLYQTSPCSLPDETHLYMTTEDSAAVPYRGGETLRYQRSINGVIKDTLVFESVPANQVAEKGEGCCCDGCYSEAVFHHPEWVYQTTDERFLLNIRLELQANECGSSLPVPWDPILFFEINLDQGYQIWVRLEGIVGIHKPAYLTYHEQLVIGNQEYQKVWQIGREGDDDLHYYSEQNGLLIFQDNITNTTITLL